MQAGSLDHTITFQQQGTIINMYGEKQINSWADVLKTKASIKSDGCNLVTVNNEPFYSYQYTFCVWLFHKKTINESMRIKFNDKYYRILSIIESRKRKQLEIKAELINE